MQNKVTNPGGGHSYIIEGMDVRQGLSKPYPSQTKFSAKFWTPSQPNGENIYPKTPENEFLAVYLCIIEKTLQNLCYLIKEIMILQKFETLIA